MHTDDLSPPLKLDTRVLVYPLFLYEDTIEVCERIYDGREMFDFFEFFASISDGIECICKLLTREFSFKTLVISIIIIILLLLSLKLSFGHY